MENFLNSDEAAHIIARARPHMAKSGVALKDADKGKAAKEFPVLVDERLPAPDKITVKREPPDAKPPKGKAVKVETDPDVLPEVGTKIKMRWNYNPATLKGGGWYHGEISDVSEINGTVDVEMNDGDQADDLDWAWAVTNDIIKRK